MKNILSHINSIENHKIVFWILQVLWGLALVFWLLLMCAIVVEFLDAGNYEYYGYRQWPWYLHNIWISRHYMIIEFLLVFLCVAYSIRLRKKSMLLAILCMALPYIYFHFQVALLDLNG